MSFYVQYFQELNKKLSICLHGNFLAKWHIRFKLSLLIPTLWCWSHLPGGQQHTLTLSVRHCHRDLGPGRQDCASRVCSNSVLWCLLSFQKKSTNQMSQDFLLSSFCIYRTQVMEWLQGRSKERIEEGNKVVFLVSPLHLSVKIPRLGLRRLKAHPQVYLFAKIMNLYFNFSVSLLFSY